MVERIQGVAGDREMRMVGGMISLVPKKKHSSTGKVMSDRATLKVKDCTDVFVIKK